ncbi:MAG: ABC transporter permease [Candidatus Cloacimonetes bacterium]|nr:ABC transporter permease [Candidatus Cloacimonadota bacterium]MCF7814642.1 ABC transporter permease [Candidatus Cloacimonadota bacterium]MCF7869109.1 ABC transporter permease [Candidatus Cloacimonadota bacterium]MCF7884528.1 ABC transporter permease [Candidatus Cloacimonadota bacterium]
MHFIESVGSSFQNIFTHKLRSSLTLLGIVIGVFAVVTMFSSVYGLKQLITEKMADMGWNNSLIIYPSSGEESGRSRRRFRFRYIRREAKPLTFSDYEMLKSETRSKSIYGYINSYDKFYYNEIEGRVRISATNNEFFQNKTYVLQKGRFFNTFEERNAVKVCIIGYYFADRYFKQDDPIDKMITVGENRYKIIGILAEDILNKDGMDFNRWERYHDLRSVYIPLSTGSMYLRNDNAIDYIYIQAYDGKSFWKLKTQVTQKLLAKHKMTRDFTFNDVGALMYQITNEIGEMMKKWNITLSAIASISLIVGGIGLFSTLLISINERMMEIGIRKSIGATNLDILFLFLMESIILALLGSFVGIAISTVVVQIIAKAINFSFPIPIEGVLLGLGFAFGIGLLSGLYPSIKASKIDPIKAIYYFE